ncbi:Thrombopoietin receptor [Lonchura striata]|uniref:Thrombopoietin receptor n=1 Tax=Lonchura striata TaxID=40157 RepID=A0A218VE56_9PASE|nr:Thrombopoietin receptor [Lonchura striata domestica]
MATLLPDAALLAGVSEDILCFSRSFEDLTCFWDEEETTTGMCHFYYWYSSPMGMVPCSGLWQGKELGLGAVPHIASPQAWPKAGGAARPYSPFHRDVPTECVVSTWHHGAGRKRHVCVFPSQDVRLFTQLHLHVLDATTNHTKYWRELSVDAVGLIAPPVNITARWAGAAGQLCVLWQPPLADFPNFFLYEVQCCPASSPGMPGSTTLNPTGQHPGDPSIQSTVSTHTPRAGAASPGLGQRLIQANTWVVLQDLQPGVRYHIQVRSKPDGTSMDGVWGPWSQAVAAETPHSSGDIGLCCSTPDLRHVRCEWSWDPAEPHSSHQLFYQPPPSRAGTREDAWQECKEVSRGTQGTHACTFQPKADSAISILVNVTRSHMLPTLSYFKEPFWLHQAVLTDAPQFVQATVLQGRLSLQWLPPLELLAEQLDYQVRYAMENSHDWKVLQVPRAARKEFLDLRPGIRYHAQVRAQPSGPWYQGSWSAWSKPVVVDAVADPGKGLCQGGAALSLGTLHGALGHPKSESTFDASPSVPSNVKQKLWPPVPDLHRALGSFLQESSKHGQGSPYRVRSVSRQASAFDKQPPEEAVLPCLLEVLPDPRREAGPPPEHAGGRLSSTDIANQSYLLMSGWEPRAATAAPTPP